MLDPFDYNGTMLTEKNVAIICGSRLDAIK